MTTEEIIADERYHTCGRCKWEKIPYICHQCKWGEDTRKDLWELKESEEVCMNIGDRVKFMTAGGWCNSGIIKDMDEDSYLIEVDKLGCEPPKDVNIQLPYYARVLSCEILIESEGKEG